MRPKVSAALIVRDEERFLAGCLESLRGKVDEIVVVDTGSRDGTIAIARAAKARLLHFPWCDDFAAARNFGLEAAHGDWILYIDADERLEVPDGRHITDGLDGAGLWAARVRFIPRLKWTPHRELRLFRNDPQLRFAGRIHETIVPALNALIASRGAQVAASAATLTHLGYEGDLTHKHRRNLPMLEAAVIADPQRLYYWHHLAETQAAMGDSAAAMATCRRGLEVARAKRVGRATNDVATLIAMTYARLLRDAGIDAGAVIDEGLDFYPDNRALLFLRARILVDRGDYDAAMSIIDALRFVDGPGFEDPTLSYDSGIFGAYAHNLAGVAFLRQGRRAEAAEAFALAAQADPDDPSYRIKAAAVASPQPSRQD